MELRWLGPLLDLSGYASAGRGYLRACEAADIVIQPRDRSRSLNLKDKGMDAGVLEMYERLSKNEVAPDCPTVQHQVPDVFFEDTRSRLRIGYTIFEMSRVPEPWVPCCNKMDVIWTGSEYSRQAFVASGVKVPVRVLPHAIDLDAYSPDGPRWNISNKRGFAFISVMDFTARKAWKDMLRAYWHAFRPADDVCLILKAYFGDFSDQSRKDIVRRIVKHRTDLKVGEASPILLYGHDVQASNMPALYRSADCYVGISREGFGLSFSEAMACGLPCIGPEVGGTRQYMTPENSLLVRHVGEEPIDREIVRMFPSFDGLTWAKHSWEHLAEVMRGAYENKNLRDSVAKKGLEHVRRELSFKSVGNRIKELLS
jgi:glycosyltransferase involved in cell wall biosynthesis